MAIKTTINYSPNFDLKKRKKKQVKYLVFHYTGMRSEKSAICRLTKIQSEVSSHYLVKKNGEILTLVPDLYIAWHSGKSKWFNEKSLNKNSIGIEITNKGHQYGYEKFTLNQIKSLIKLSKILIKKYKIKQKNIVGHSDIAFDRKKDPGEKFPWKVLSKNKIGIWHNLKKLKLQKLRNDFVNKNKTTVFFEDLKKIGYSVKTLSKTKKRFVVEAFQRRYRPELINGKIDRELCYIAKKISNSLT